MKEFAPSISTLIRFAVRLAVSSVLVLAVISKIQIAPAILAGNTMLASPLLLYVAISIESAVGVWVLIAPNRATWRVIIGLFSCLSIIAIWALLTKRDCNCFGSVIPNRYSLPIDIIILFVTASTGRLWTRINTPAGASGTQGSGASTNRRPPRKRIAISVIASLVVSGTAVTTLRVSLQDQKVTSDLKFLLADDWIGKEWPIGEDYHLSLRTLFKGTWLVLVLRPDCDHCQSLVKSLANTKPMDREIGLPITTFVAGGATWAIHFGNASLATESDTIINWIEQEEPFVSSPAVFVLQNGKIINAMDGEKSDQLVREWMKIGE